MRLLSRLAGERGSVGSLRVTSDTYVTRVYEPLYRRDSVPSSSSSSFSSTASDVTRSHVYSYRSNANVGIVARRRNALQGSEEWEGAAGGDGKLGHVTSGQLRASAARAFVSFLSRSISSARVFVFIFQLRKNEPRTVKIKFASAQTSTAQRTKLRNFSK